MPLVMRVLAIAALFLTILTMASARGDVEQARPWIGIQLDKGEKGVKIVEVYKDTPGAKAGLKAEDEVLELDGAAVKTAADLIARVQEKGVGETVALTLLRSGKTISVKLKLEARPDEVQMLKGHLLGKAAPDFALADYAGPHAAKLSELKGNVIIVEFFATWCGPCRASLPTITGWQDKYGAKGLKIIAISSEEWGAVISPYAKEHKLPYTVASDPDGKVSFEGYRIPAIPAIVVIDRDGIVRHVDVGAGDKLDEAEALFVPLLDAKQKQQQKQKPKPKQVLKPTLKQKQK